MMMGLYVDFKYNQIFEVTTPIGYTNSGPIPNWPIFQSNNYIGNNRKAIKVIIIKDELEECNNNSPILTLGADFGDSFNIPYEKAKIPTTPVYLIKKF